MNYGEKYENQKHQKPVGRMSSEEMEIFLAKGYTLRLACLKPNGDPFVIPCWHHWENKMIVTKHQVVTALTGVFGSFPDHAQNGLHT